MAHPVYNPIRPLLIALAWLYLTAPGRAADKDDLLAVRVLPLLKEKCLACHGDDAQKLNGKLDLRSRAGVLKGGASGKPAVVPGKPEQSPLFLAVTRQNPDLVMPPKDNDRLSAEQVELIRQWITAGAPWPVGHVSNVPSSGHVGNVPHASAAGPKAPIVMTAPAAAGLFPWPTRDFHLPVPRPLRDNQDRTQRHT